MAFVGDHFDGAVCGWRFHNQTADEWRMRVRAMIVFAKVAGSTNTRVHLWLTPASRNKNTHRSQSEIKRTSPTTPSAASRELHEKFMEEKTNRRTLSYYFRCDRLTYASVVLTLSLHAIYKTSSEVGIKLNGNVLLFPRSENNKRTRQCHQICKSKWWVGGLTLLLNCPITIHFILYFLPVSPVVHVAGADGGPRPMLFTAVT